MGRRIRYAVLVDRLFVGFRKRDAGTRYVEVRMYVSSWKNNGTCVVERQLPDKDIFGIRTGQVDRDGNLLWEAEHWFEESRRWLDGPLASATSGEPAARGVFDIHLGAGSLIFVKEPCARADTEAVFFLHLIPAQMADLPGHRRQYGFDNLDLDFDQHGERFNGECLAKVPLPEYRISEIRTGQYVPVDGGFDHLWKAELRTQGSSESADATGR